MLRKRAGLRQKDIADLLGISIAWISSIELGRRPTPKWSREMVDRVALLLGDEANRLVRARIQDALADFLHLDETFELKLRERF